LPQRSRATARFLRIALRQQALQIRSRSAVVHCRPVQQRLGCCRCDGQILGETAALPSGHQRGPVPIGFDGVVKQPASAEAHACDLSVPDLDSEAGAEFSVGAGPQQRWSVDPKPVPTAIASWMRGQDMSYATIARRAAIDVKAVCVYNKHHEIIVAGRCALHGPASVRSVLADAEYPIPDYLQADWVNRVRCNACPSRDHWRPPRFETPACSLGKKKTGLLPFLSGCSCAMNATALKRRSS